MVRLDLGTEAIWLGLEKRSLFGLVLCKGYRTFVAVAEVISFADCLLPARTLSFYLLHLTSCFAPFIITTADTCRLTRGRSELLAQMSSSGVQSPKTLLCYIEAASDNMNFPILVPFYEKTLSLTIKHLWQAKTKTVSDVRSPPELTVYLMAPESDSSLWTCSAAL